MLIHFSGDWDVHWGPTGILTDGHMGHLAPVTFSPVLVKPPSSTWLEGLLDIHPVLVLGASSFRVWPCLLLGPLDLRG